MALSDFLKSNLHGDIVLGRLDHYLLTIANVKNDDRRWDVNSPSMLGTCKRRLFYSRINAYSDSDITARTMRVFDNGSKVHERLEGYLLKAGVALADEIPVVHERLNIMGHTDLLITMEGRFNLDDPFNYTVSYEDQVDGKFELALGTISVTIDEDCLDIPEIAVGEIKSINDRGFTALKDAKEEHKAQAMAYLVSLDDRRNFLRKRYKDYQSLVKAQKQEEYYEPIFERYDYLQDGAKYKREEKINHKVAHFMLTDLILYLTPHSISNMIFIYENKNTQEIKEYLVETDLKMIKDISDYATTINHYVDNYFLALRKIRFKRQKLTAQEANQLIRKHAPPKEGTKSSQLCRFCGFKTTCHGQ